MIESVINRFAWRRRVGALLAAVLITTGFSSCGQDEPSSQEPLDSSVSISDSQPSTDSSIPENSKDMPSESGSASCGAVQRGGGKQ